jgi:glycine dehydrogenase subunit 2
MLIFELSKPGRRCESLMPESAPLSDDIPTAFLRKTPPALPAVSELQVVRHYTHLSTKNFSIDGQFYPLGSCTMKYNPKIAHALASLPGFLSRHPLAPEKASQGFLTCLYALQEQLKEITGMPAVSLTPMAGAQGELAGIAMIKAYHQARNDHARTDILVPDAAHGTNPATASMSGYRVKEIPTLDNGDIDLVCLKQLLGPQTAGIMLTNPTTAGVFERHIQTVAGLVHEAGGLLYYDGANLNAILGKVRPGDMGFDVLHLNLHKTFATPHGGGGPGAGPVLANERLAPYLPVPIVVKRKAVYAFSSPKDRPQSIGRLSAFMGNAGVLLRAYIYVCLLGPKGLVRIADIATLNANYLMHQLRGQGFQLAYPDRRATHEFIITLQHQMKAQGVSAKDYGKRLLDHGIHSPTTYFPIHIAECLLIEPTETETKETLDQFVQAMVAIKAEAMSDPTRVKTAPHTMPVKRLDETKAARALDVVFDGCPDS